MKHFKSVTQFRYSQQLISLIIACHDLELDLASFCYFSNLSLPNRSG